MLRSLAEETSLQLQNLAGEVFEVNRKVEATSGLSEDVAQIMAEQQV